MEESIDNETFQLYGEDLRCLDSGQPMMSAYFYDSDIRTAIKNYKAAMRKALNNVGYKRLTIRRIGENRFIYDKTMTVDEVFETTPETDIHKMFCMFDRAKTMFKMFASTKSKVVCIVWSHSVFDGISTLKIGTNIFGYAATQQIPIQPLPYIMHKYYALETIVKLCDFLRDSQLHLDADFPQFHTTTLKLCDIKTVAKQNGVSFPATACAFYLQQLFQSLPETVQYLKVFVSVYMQNENRFNNYSAIPIVVYRNDCSPVSVNRLLNDNKMMAFGFHELFRTNLLTTLKSKMDGLKPDVIFTSMKNSDDIGRVKLKQILVYRV